MKTPKPGSTTSAPPTASYGNRPVGLLTQDTVFGRPDRTVRETYELTLGAERAESMPLRSLGLVSPRDVDLRVGELSVGQL